MRYELRTALAALVTAAVVLGSATMALADDGDVVDPDPATTTATASPDPSTTTDVPDDPDPSTSTPAPEPSETTPTVDVPDGAFTVTDALFRWGVNDESNNKAFAPGTFNFFSAGKIANPGKGGVQLKEAGWKATSGKVRIEKYSATSEKWTKATWAGLRTDTTGATMTSTNGPFSGHQVVVSGGKGTVDPAAKAATIQWTGSFTVVYYSGMSFFYVTDPKLTVKKGQGTVTATLSGYGSSMEDLTKWEAVAPKKVTLADLGAVDVTQDLGFEVTPKYAGVKVTVANNQTQQVREGKQWGSFPQSFIDYQTASGSGSYWYSSGGAADAHKVAAPLAVSYSADDPVDTEEPSSESGDTPDVTNDALTPPSIDVPVQPPGPAVPVVDAPGADDVLAGTSATQVRPVSTVTGATALTADPRTGPVWVLGAVILGLAALVGASPVAYGAMTRKR